MRARSTGRLLLPRPPRDPAQAGSILVLALLVSMVLLVLGLAAMWISSSGTQVSGHYTRRQEALHAAEAGVEIARGILAAENNWSSLLAGCGSQPVAGKGHYLCDPAGNLSKRRVVASSSETAARASGLSRLSYTVFIRNDPEEAATPLNDNNWRVVVRSEGIARDGLSSAAVEVVVVRGAPGGVGALPYAQAGISARGSSSMRGKIR